MRGRKRGELVMEILEKLYESSLGIGAVVDAILISGYRAPYSVLKAKTEKNLQSDHNAPTRTRELVLRLQREGLVKRSGASDKLSLTRKGIDLFKNRESHLPKRSYEKIPTEGFIIVIFDIPEISHHKRDWLRGVLKSLDFTMLQKSVWVGKRSIPEELLHDLHLYGLARYVEVFSAIKIGTLGEKLKNSRS